MEPSLFTESKITRNVLLISMLKSVFEKAFVEKISAQEIKKKDKNFIIHTFKNFLKWILPQSLMENEQKETKKK